MPLLIASLAALAVGPVLHRAARRMPSALAALDGFMVVALVGLVLLQVLPLAVGSAGWAAIGAAGAGLAAPGLLERSRWRRARTASRRGVEVLALAGLALHAVADGVTLAVDAGHGAGPGALALAVLLHQVPAGLGIWWLVRMAAGTRAAVAVLGGTALATVAGYAAGLPLSASTGPGFAVFQAAVGGSLLHVVLHPHHAGGPSMAGTAARRAAGLGAVAAGVVLWSLSTHPVGGAPSGEVGAGGTFVALALESAPALLLAFLGAGMLPELLPRASLAWLRRGGASAQAVRGVAFGLPLPLCSCGVVPFYRGLVTRGAPAPAAMALLVAAPELSFAAVMISLPLLGGTLTAARVVAAAAVALAVGWGVGRLAGPAAPLAPDDEAAVDSRGTPWERVIRGARFGLGDVVDHTAPWILLGLGIAAWVDPLLGADAIGRLPGGVDVPVAALLGMPAYVCASGATPLVAVLIHKGLSPGAAIAFLLTGPATNVTTFGVLARLHGPRVAAAFAAVMATLAIAFGVAVNAVLPAGGAIPLHAVADEAPGAWELVSGVALAGVLFASLLRQGVRGFMEPVLSPFAGQGEWERGGGRGHGHGHGHGHDHGRGHDHDHGHGHGGGEGGRSAAGRGVGARS